MFKIKTFFPSIYSSDMARVHLLTSNSSYDLVRHVPDVFDGKRLEIVLLQEIISTEAKQLKCNTNVSMVVKPVQHAYTSAEAGENN